ncbi:hypothetical protein M422DRAFT_36841 [Sphaerobolus stellatus SS14]|uniref:Unplaced genomic scaffold SPHSTscaffold_200, whole genome shotgun sequence n=1 Tax=Sphaerobolus stellatus (strain SS14) TaxID=990650 RepID=A0A0C9UWX2_SPHS4|nr:hypothetical protein M422DRAFT_36841 [Sphaerobolus stellatus SS14]
MYLSEVTKFSYLAYGNARLTPVRIVDPNLELWLKLELDGPAGDAFLGSSSTSFHTSQDLDRSTAKQFQHCECFV